jgi:hypothetical protein
MSSFSHTKTARRALQRYRAALEDGAVFGMVTAPTARPPIAPARTPSKARTSVLSINVAFLLDIDFFLQSLLLLLADFSASTYRGIDCRKRLNPLK